MDWRSIVRVVAFVCAASVVINSYFVFANWRSVAENGTEIHLWYSLLLLLPILMSLLVMPISLLGLFVKPREMFASIGLASFAYFVIGVMMIRLGDVVRTDGFERLAARSERLIDAIGRYEHDVGRPPGKLSDLVPGYLAKVPGTRMAAYPRYVYLVGSEARRYEDNPWVLLVGTPSGGINFDIFYYTPRRNYPEEGHGGTLEQIGDWAYVHE